MKNFRTNACNVLVIGSGGAGLRAAIEAHKEGSEVLVIGKRIRNDAHTTLASGGINAVLGSRDPEDNWKQHFVDTYQEGYNIADPNTVEILVKDAPNRIKELDDWGMPFAKTKDGKIDQRYFGAHTYRRTCYAGDYTGRAILNTLLKKVEELKIPIIDLMYVSQLLVDKQSSEKHCFGALAFDIVSGERTVFLADSVVLAAGGHTRIWRRSSSRRDENTGDAIRLALRAGCKLADMEMVQFHPTGMVHPESLAGTLVTEAVRGEGGYLLNKNGERFMKHYDSERMELSTRDRVAMANYNEIIEGRGTENGGVLLDISHKSKEFIIEKLPRMYRQFLDTLMIDISKSPMEVSPTAHYSMGGVVVEPFEHTTHIEGLYAAGEVTGGLHGANRLGGNSLAEILIFGKRAGYAAALRSMNMLSQQRSPEVIKNAHDKIDSFIKNGNHVARPLQRELRDIMWENCGVLREESKLKDGLNKINILKDSIEHLDVRPDSEGFEDLMLAFDLEGSIMSAEATILGAIERKESRGAHQRNDYSEISQDMSANFNIKLNNSNELEVDKVDLKKMSKELSEIINNTQSITDFSGMLLE